MTAGYSFYIFGMHLPTLVALVVGLVLLLRRRPTLGRRRATLAMLGIIALLITELVGATWSILIPLMPGFVDYGGPAFLILNYAAGIISTVLGAAGVALLIAAAISRPRPAPTAGYPTLPPYDPPSTFSTEPPAPASYQRPTDGTPGPWSPPAN